MTTSVSLCEANSITRRLNVEFRDICTSIFHDAYTTFEDHLTVTAVAFTYDLSRRTWCGKAHRDLWTERQKATFTLPTRNHFSCVMTLVSSIVSDWVTYKAGRY